MKAYITVTQCADLLGLSDRRIRQLAASSEIKAEKLGPRYWLICRDSAIAWSKIERRPGPPAKS